MASESKPPLNTNVNVGPRRDKGIRVFTYPKVIFMFPTLVVAVVCWLGMVFSGDVTADPLKAQKTSVAATNGTDPPPVNVNTNAKADAKTPATALVKHERFTTPQNIFAVLFLLIFAFNLLIMAIDFPRFTIVGVVLLILFGIFFVLWLGAAFDIKLMEKVRDLMGGIYAAANAEFYLLLSVILAGIFGIIFVTRYLDYWELLPNEILHHHGPLSDLERYPTHNLKFDKEIPDVLEHLFLGSGRLVLHVADERKSIVLDNVLFINAVENALKTLMSRTEVRLTTDQEVSDL